MKGWECPKCGRCYAPTVEMCSSCVPSKAVDVGTVTFNGWQLHRVCTCGQSTWVGDRICPIHGGTTCRSEGTYDPLTSSVVTFDPSAQFSYTN